jgi:hypothetical protein
MAKIISYSFSRLKLFLSALAALADSFSRSRPPGIKREQLSLFIAIATEGPQAALADSFSRSRREKL